VASAKEKKASGSNARTAAPNVDYEARLWLMRKSGDSVSIVDK